MSAASIRSFIKPSPPRRAPEALVAREVDDLIAQLLAEIKVPFNSIGKRVAQQLADLKKVLMSDYEEAPALPEKPMLRELSTIVEKEIKANKALWSSIDNERRPVLEHLGRIFGSRELELRTEKYTQGAGLALRGFFCRANLGERDKFVIFLNTAHHPGAVAATLGHELGHYIYGSLMGENESMTAFMEGAFANHLEQNDELFADSLVALSAYSPELLKRIGVVGRTEPGKSRDLFGHLKLAYDLIGPSYNLDLTKGKMAAAWRVRYLTSMTHFFKLRCALFKTAAI
jgi:hypothetical protein